MVWIALIGRLDVLPHFIPSGFDLQCFDEFGLQARRSLLEIDEMANLVVGVVGQSDRRFNGPFLGDCVREVLLGWNCQLEAIDVGRFFLRLVLADESKALTLAVGVLDQERAISGGAIGDVVNVFVTLDGVRVDDPLDRFDGGDSRSTVARLDCDFGAQVDGIVTSRSSSGCRSSTRVSPA